MAATRHTHPTRTQSITDTLTHPHTPTLLPYTFYTHQYPTHASLPHCTRGHTHTLTWPHTHMASTPYPPCSHTNTPSHLPCVFQKHTPQKQTIPLPRNRSQRAREAHGLEPWKVNFFQHADSPLCHRGASGAAHTARWKGLHPRSARAAWRARHSSNPRRNF